MPKPKPTPGERIAAKYWMYTAWDGWGTVMEWRMAMDSAAPGDAAKAFDVLSQFHKKYGPAPKGKKQ